jgi:enoyl-CoA hydratase/carnithine racemase
MADVNFTIEGHIAQVRLHRPQGLNAITQEMDDLLFETVLRNRQCQSSCRRCPTTA